MREESHLDEMRAAIRGDFERLERRRGSQRRLIGPRTPLEPIEELDEALEDGEERKEPTQTWLTRLFGR